MPTVCPECSSVLVYEIVGKEKSAALYCKNDLCPAKHIEELIHFVSKKGLNIEGLGDKIIESFHDIGLISNAPSIFKLKKGDIAGLEGFGEKSEENILSSIDKARLVPLNRFLYSLGIRHIGEQTAKDLATHFLTLNTLRWASFEELSSVSGVGEKVACSLTEYFKDKKKIKELEQLLQEITLEETHKKSGNIFSGMTFVITGTLPTLSRDEAKKLIEDNGGKVSSSVSIKTSYLLKGENGGSKAMEALKFGVKTIEEGELLRMVKM
jgi:DNA ligase (NAD+)